MIPTDKTAENLRQTEARIKENHAGKSALGLPPSKPDPKHVADRAALLAVVNRAVDGKKK